MNTIFQINADELDGKFLDTLKKLFKNKKLVISVMEDTDETAYLLQSESNSQRLFNALEEIKTKKDLMIVNSVEELEALVNG
ncbi:MAG: hypothetical protein HY963_01115 [Ignavibacteriales bacterium]|jgi:ACT domain-containing protein|nr:hypothetical protein [Ignavibacteriales bacterium]